LKPSAYVRTIVAEIKTITWVENPLPPVKNTTERNVGGMWYVVG
jgi:hypothetical protein